MAYEIIYFVSLAATKMSILLFYTRLFPTRGFKLAAKVVACIVAAWLIATILVSIFSCNPVRAFWTHEAGSKCINSEHFYIANAVPNIITDAFILTLPLRMVWGLHTSKWERVALTFIFMLGSLYVNHRVFFWHRGSAFLIHIEYPANFLHLFQRRCSEYHSIVTTSRSFQPRLYL
jgi:hypothetical protein